MQSYKNNSKKIVIFGTQHILTKFTPANWKTLFVKYKILITTFDLMSGANFPTKSFFNI